MKGFIINGVLVELEVADNQIYTTSLHIAEVFEKDHKHIIAKIKELPQDDFNQPNFRPVNYVDKKGEYRPMYNLTRDGFSLLVMGFTGERAYKWKVEFIKAFNLMENMLKEKQAPLSTLDMLDLSIQVAKEHDKRIKNVEAQQRKIEHCISRQTAGQEYMTIIGYASINHINANLYNPAILGKRCKKIGDELGYRCYPIADKKYGSVNTYHIDILEKVFQEKELTC